MNREVIFCENSKKKKNFLWGGFRSGGGGHRVDVNKELKFFGASG